MKNFLFILAVVGLSGSNAFAANLKSDRIWQHDIKTYSFSSSNVAQIKTINTTITDDVRSKPENSKEHIYKILAEYVPADTGSPDRRGSQGTQGGQSGQGSQGGQSWQGSQGTQGTSTKSSLPSSLGGQGTRAGSALPSSLGGQGTRAGSALPSSLGGQGTRAGSANPSTPAGQGTQGGKVVKSASFC